MDKQARELIHLQAMLLHQAHQMVLAKKHLAGQLASLMRDGELSVAEYNKTLSEELHRVALTHPKFIVEG